MGRISWLVSLVIRKVLPVYQIFVLLTGFMHTIKLVLWNCAMAMPDHQQNR